MAEQRSLFGDDVAPAPAKRRRPRGETPAATRDAPREAFDDEQRVELEPTDPSVADIDRELVRREGLYRFVQLAWHLVEPSRPFLPGKHIEVLCQFLEEASRSEGGTWVINVPPGTGKSLIVSVLWPAWVWTWEPKHRWICTSYSDRLVRRDSLRQRELVDSPWYRDRWGGGVPHELGRREDDWQNAAGGGRIASPAGGQIHGRHADTVIVDDPIKPDDARLERAELERIATWWDETIPSRLLHPGTGRRVIVMQRLHELDLSGRAIARGARHLVLPMRFEPDHPRRSERDWRTEPGELLWPEGRPEEDVRALEAGTNALTPYAQAGQLQQRPAPEGGGMIKVAKLGRYTRLPRDRGTGCMALDSKFKETTDGAFAAIVYVRLVDSKIYVEDLWHERAGALRTANAYIEMAAAHPECAAKIVEEAANGPAVCELLEGKLSGVIRVKPKGGKESRAHQTAAYVEAGDVLLNERNPELVRLVTTEGESYPNGATKDIWDAIAHAVNFLVERESGYSVVKLMDAAKGRR